MTEPLARLIRPLPPPSDPELVTRVLDDMRERSAKPDGDDSAELLKFIDASEPCRRLFELVDHRFEVSGRIGNVGCDGVDVPDDLLHLVRVHGCDQRIHTGHDRFKLAGNALNGLRKR